MCNKMAPPPKGLATGIVTSGWSLSLLIVTLAQMFFINPNNFPPSSPPFPGSTEVYFTQDELLNRVPFVILLLGVLCTPIQLVGSVFLVIPFYGEPGTAVSNGELPLREFVTKKESAVTRNATHTSNGDSHSQRRMVECLKI